MNKKKVVLLGLGILILFFVILNVTYAWWRLTRIQEDTNDLIASCLNFDMLSDTEGINISGEWPMSDEDGLASEKNIYAFTVTNHCPDEVYYDISLERFTTEKEISNSAIKVALDNEVAGIYEDFNNSEKFDAEAIESKKIGGSTVAGNSSKTHYLKLWIDENADISNQGKSFQGKIFIIGGQGIEDKNLYNVIKKKADIETAIDFSVKSGLSGTNGIYITTNTESGKPVYYYRGKVDNNIIFGGFCWKILRTTETGGTKILYNGIPNENGECTEASGMIGNSSYNTTRNDNTYVGYMYGNAGSSTYAATHSNESDSTIKTVLDNWYEENIKNKGFDTYLEDTVFCNDRNLVDGTTNNKANSNAFKIIYGVLGYGKNPTGYGSLARSSYWTLNANPSLACKNETGFVPENNDAFTVSNTIGNGKLKYPVGLITTDELIFAGNNPRGNYEQLFEFTDHNFLSSGEYWTMTPTVTDSSSAYIALMSEFIFEEYINHENGVRPVVSLKSGIKIESGNGTQVKPYIVE